MVYRLALPLMLFYEKGTGLGSLLQIVKTMTETEGRRFSNIPTCWRQSGYHGTGMTLPAKRT